EALRVYQALLAQRPGDQRLRARVAGLASGDSRASGAETGESVPTFLRRILAGRPPAGRPVASPDPAPLPLPESSGSLLDGAFAIAPPELDPVPEIVAPGEASRPADDSITLDAVFGEESPHSAVATDASAPPPEEPAPATAPPPPGGFSFDQFFTPPSAPAPPAGGPPGAEGGAAPAGPALGIDVSWTQTNHEGELVDAIQGLKGKADGLVINAAAYTHTSLAVRDALLAVRLPFVEVHLSNLFAREPERRRSMLADAAVGMVTGFGAESYRLGLEGLVGYLQARHGP